MIIVDDEINYEQVANYEQRRKVNKLKYLKLL
jgi:hypothetical protein